VNNEYAVLTTYVPRLEEMGLNVNERWEVRRGLGLAGLGWLMPVVCNHTGRWIGWDG